jgi:tetratricopeptide (TPR) repeat protein
VIYVSNDTESHTLILCTIYIPFLFDIMCCVCVLCFRKMFRKVPYATVSDLFTKLSIDLQRTGQKHYSAQCMLAAAKCEELNNTPLHAAYFYLNAGRVFAHTSTSEKQIKYFTAEEFAIEAMDAFKNSIEIYETHTEYSMCSTLCFELAQMLYILEKYEESGTYFMKSFAYASPTYNFQDSEVQIKDMAWHDVHHLLFSESQATTQLQALRNAVNSYLKTGDYEAVTQILQLQQTLLTQQYQAVVSGPNCATSPTDTKKLQSGSITLHSAAASGANRISPFSFAPSAVSSFNSMATLLFKERLNIYITLLLVLLIQKRKKESTQCMEELSLTLNMEYEQSNTTSFF